MTMQQLMTKIRGLKLRNMLDIMHRAQTDTESMRDYEMEIALVISAMASTHNIDQLKERAAILGIDTEGMDEYTIACHVCAWRAE